MESREAFERLYPKESLLLHKRKSQSYDSQLLESTSICNAVITFEVFKTAYQASRAQAIDECYTALDKMPKPWNYHKCVKTIQKLKEQP